MMSLNQLSNQVEACAEGKVSLNAFEDWFRENSRNVHLWGDPELNDLVDALESVFSERYFENISESEARCRLHEEVRLLARPFASRHEMRATYAVRALSVAAAAAVIVLSVAPERDILIPVQGKQGVLPRMSVVGNPSVKTASASEPVPLGYTV